MTVLGPIMFLLYTHDIIYTCIYNNDWDFHHQSYLWMIVSYIFSDSPAVYGDLFPSSGVPSQLN